MNPFANFSCNSSQIYCEGPILKAVQEARLFNDSKYFVDMPLKFDPMATLKDFEKVVDKIKDDRDLLSKFVDSHFSPPGTDLETCVPDDWKPSFFGLSKVKDEKFRFWAEQLHLMWKDLCRQIRALAWKVGKK
uniref:Trehalase n=1 Tax=Romanomermis culicivorax TaxID=13658 RepID=A0A915HM11_ROMCU